MQDEGYIKKKKGLGTIVIHKHTNTINIFGLLLPGAGESEIFSIINDQLLKQSETGKFNCLWEGATASSAHIRRTLIETCCENYIKKKYVICKNQSKQKPPLERRNLSAGHPSYLPAAKETDLYRIFSPGN